MSNILMVKKDAQIPVVIGTALIQNLQKILFNLTAEKTPEDVAAFQAAITSGAELPEPWMEDVQTLVSFLQVIEQKAVEAGMTYEQDVNQL